MGSSFVEIGRPTYHVVKLEIEENCFIGDATKCCDGTPDKNKNLLLSKLLKRSIGIFQYPSVYWIMNYKFVKE